MVYKVHKIGYKWTLNGVAFSCSNAWVNHNYLRIMFSFLVSSYSRDTGLSNSMESYPSRENITAVSCSDLNHQQTMTPLTCSQTPWQSNYSHIKQLNIWIYNLISIRFWLGF